MNFLNPQTWKLRLQKGYEMSKYLLKPSEEMLQCNSNAFSKYYVIWLSPESLNCPPKWLKLVDLGLEVRLFLLLKARIEGQTGLAGTFSLLVLLAVAQTSGRPWVHPTSHSENHTPESPLSLLRTTSTKPRTMLDCDMLLYLAKVSFLSYFFSGTQGLPCCNSLSQNIPALR